MPEQLELFNINDQPKTRICYGCGKGKGPNHVGHNVTREIWYCSPYCAPKEIYDYWISLHRRNGDTI